MVTLGRGYEEVSGELGLVVLLLSCTEEQDKEKIKTLRITDEGWNSQKRLSDPVEKKMKEGKRRKKRLLYLHPKLSSGLVPL